MAETENWFTIDQVDESTYIISEYRHWLQGEFPLPIQAVKNMVADRCKLPGDFPPMSFGRSSPFPVPPCGIVGLPAVAF